MTQTEAVIWLLRQEPHSAMDFVRSEFGLALSYRRAISQARQQLKLSGETIVLRKAVKREDGIVVNPAEYAIEPLPDCP